MYASACVCVCVRVCARVYVRVCAYVCACMYSITNNAIQENSWQWPATITKDTLLR